jgi:hypothetical protein
MENMYNIFRGVALVRFEGKTVCGLAETTFKSDTLIVFFDLSAAHSLITTALYIFTYNIYTVSQKPLSQVSPISP